MAEDCGPNSRFSPPSIHPACNRSFVRIENILLSDHPRSRILFEKKKRKEEKKNGSRLTRAITSRKFLSKVFPRLTSVINFCYALPGAGESRAPRVYNGDKNLVEIIHGPSLYFALLSIQRPENW